MFCFVLCVRVSECDRWRGARVRKYRRIDFASSSRQRRESRAANAGATEAVAAEAARGGGGAATKARGGVKGVVASTAAAATGELHAWREKPYRLCGGG